jgi:hypothetical protein
MWSSSLEAAHTARHYVLRSRDGKWVPARRRVTLGLPGALLPLSTYFFRMTTSVAACDLIFVLNLFAICFDPEEGDRSGGATALRVRMSSFRRR